MLDAMRMRTACFARALQRYTSRLSKHFFLTFQEVTPPRKTRNQLKTLYPVPPEPSTDPAYLAAAAVHSLIHPLPSGTAFCIGIVLIVMMTGRFVQTKGSLARAVLPFVVHLRWGWHRVERAMERGTFSLDAMFDRAADWCLAHLPIEPVRLGRAHREVNAIDSSTIARLRAGARLALAGKGYCHRAGRAVRANIVAALTSVVMIKGYVWAWCAAPVLAPAARTRWRASWMRCPPPRGNGSSSWMQALPPRSSLPRRPSRTPCWGAYGSTSSCGVLLHHHGQTRAASCPRRGDPSRARRARGGTGRGAAPPWGGRPHPAPALASAAL